MQQMCSETLLLHATLIRYSLKIHFFKPKG